jgi:hypothetical protein
VTEESVGKKITIVVPWGNVTPPTSSGTPARPRPLLPLLPGRLLLI